MKPYYITTPIYYVNDAPHLGHAYTTIAADVCARFQRARGRDTYFLTGTDEHGQKVEEAAKKRGVSPKALADSVVVRFQDTWKNLDISHDDFIRTTEPRHQDMVATMWKRMEEAGDIYLDGYKGWYCVACEAFYPETQLEDKKCPTHHTEPTWVEEPSYFFRMSKYQEQLLRHIADNPDFIQPDNYRREVVSFIESGLRDLSVSRTTFSWGIRVPGDEKHVIYVWIDALTNYLSALGGPDSKHWPATCHLIGKDILRFHAVYWPTMLMSAGIPLPKQVFAHGWWTLKGEKISKSLPATRVDPNQLAADIGADALRYFLLREVPLGNDGDFTYESLIGRINADLANDLGNLFSRSTTMASKFTQGKVPEPGPDDGADHQALTDEAEKAIADATDYFERMMPTRALESIWNLVRHTNRYVNDSQPWVLAKDPANAAALQHCTYRFLAANHLIARLIAPVMPSTARRMLECLGLTQEDVAAALATYPKSGDATALAPGSAIEKAAPMFPRIDGEKQKELLARWLPDTPASAVTPKDKPKKQTGKPEVTFDEFGKMDLRTARIESAEAVPKAKKLLRLTVSLGDLGTRQVVAGLAEVYKPEQLVGRTVIFLANLKPATIRGVESQGMILAVGDKDVVGLSAVDNDVAPGEVVR